MGRRALTLCLAPRARRRPRRARPVDGRGGARAPGRRRGRRARPLCRPPAGRPRLRRRAGRSRWRGSERGASSPPRRSFFSAALALTLAVFAPGHRRARRGRAALGPPRAFSRAARRPFFLARWRCWSQPPATPRARRLAAAGALLAVLALVIEPDFSAAAIALAVAFAALAGGGVAGRRLLPAAGLLLIALGDRRDTLRVRRRTGSAAFVSPESDRRGKGFEVLALAHANAAGASHGVGLGHGSSRHRLSSPGQRLRLRGGRRGAGTRRRVRRRRRLAGHRRGRGAGGALAGGPPRSVPRARRWPASAPRSGPRSRCTSPSAVGWLPIIGVTMPLAQLRSRADHRLGRRAGAAGGDRARRSGGARVNPLFAPLFDRTLIVISGKGGVGRTTVAAALARAAADAGKRVLIAASAPTDRLGHLYGRTPLGPTVTTLAPGIDAVNMTPESALREYGVLTLRSELVARALLENRAAALLLERGPGAGRLRDPRQGLVAHHRARERPPALRPHHPRRPGQRPRGAHAANPRRDPGRHAQGSAGPRRPRHRRAAARSRARGAA